MNKTTSASRKLLAAVAVFAMVAAAFSLVAVTDDVNAAEVSDPAAKIGEQGYATLEEAIAEANKNADETTVILLKDVTVGDAIKITQPLVLKSEGMKTISFNGQGILVKGESPVTATIEDVKIVRDGGNTGATVKASSGSTLNLNNVEIAHAGEVSSAIGVQHAASKVVVNGGKIVDTSANALINFVSSEDGTVTLKGGVVIETKNAVSAGGEVSQVVMESVAISADPSDYVSSSVSMGGFYFVGDAAIAGAKNVKSGEISGEFVFSKKAQVIEFNKNVEFNNFTLTYEGSSVVLNDVKVMSKVMKFAAGSIEFSGAVASVTPGAGTVTISGQAALSGNLNLQDVDIAVSPGATFTTPAKTTLNVDEKSTVSGEGNLVVANGSTVNVSGDLSGIKIENNGSIVVTTADAKIPDNMTGEGDLNIDGAVSDAVLGGELRTDTEFGKYQIVTATSDLTLVNGTDLAFEGKFIVPAGVTVTIQPGATLTVRDVCGIIENNGTIVVVGNATAAGSMVVGSALINNGTVKVYGENGAVPTVTVDGKLTNNKAIAVGAYGKVQINGELANNTDATVTVDGLLVNNGTVNNNGVFTVNNKIKSTSDFNNFDMVVVNGTFDGTVTMMNESAVVDIQKLVAKNENQVELTVVNASDYSKKSVSNSAQVTLTVKGVAAVPEPAKAAVPQQISSMKITATYKANLESDKKTVRNYTVEFFVSGEAAANVNEEKTLPAATVAFSGSVTVADKFTVGTNVNFTNSGVLNVTGEMTVLSKAGTVSNTTAYITGKLVMYGKVLNGNYYAAYYDYEEGEEPNKVTVTVYTTLENAIASGDKNITVKAKDKLVIKENITVPAEVTVTISVADDRTDDFKTGFIVIDKDATLTVANGGKLAYPDEYILVNGTLVIEDKNKGVEPKDNIISDVKYDSETSVTYTNLIRALNNAVSGDVIVFNADTDTVTVKENIVIKEGVTLQIDADKTLNVDNNVTLTIDGTLYLNDGNIVMAKKIDDKKDAAEYVLNGVVKNNNDMADDAVVKYPAGAYYSISAKSIPTYYIEPLANALAKITTFDDYTVNVYGDVSGDYTVKGAEGKTANVILNSAFKTGTFTLDLATLKITDKFEGSVTDGVGTFAYKSVSENNDVTVASAVKDKAKAFTVSGNADIGTATDAADKYKVVFSGDVAVNGLTAGKVTVDGKVTVASNSAFADTMVNGTLKVASNKTLTLGNTTVLGTIDATADKSKVEVTGDMFIGIEKGDLSASAAVNGSLVTVTKVITVASGSAVDAKIVENKKKVDFMVDGALWVTAYGAGSVAVPKYVPTINDALFKAWKPSNGTFPATFDDIDGKALVVTAEIVKDIYKVEVLADEGIGTVAIDGNVLRNSSGNVFILDYNLKAGDHTVSFKFKEGYEGKVTLTVNGQATTGLTFVATGNASFDDEGNLVPVKFVLNLQGAEPIPPAEPIVPPTPVPPTPVDPVEPADEGLTITDYLLIVLVVLIAIMAIMVAMKLMRS